MNKYDSIKLGDTAEIKHVITNEDLSKFVDLTGDDNRLHVDKNYAKIAQLNFSNKDLKAFDILGLDVTINWENIRSKFKKLVKKFHPDMNSGNRKFEEKLKVITLAYTQLKRALKK